MPIYLHELVDVVPGRAADYARSMARHHGSAATKRGQADSMVGLFTAIEATGVWPQNVNLWQYGTWDDVERQLARQFEPAKQDAGLKHWWLSNLDLREGGCDRLLESPPWAPDVGALRRSGVVGTLFLHQIVSLVPGTADAYLAALGERGVAALEGAGARLVGAYRTCLRNDEAVVLLSFEAPEPLARFQREWYEGSTSLARWRKDEDEWVRGKESLLLKPHYFLVSPWHP